MTSQWYYGRESDISGPVTDRQLFDLAARGEIVPTDTVWRDAIEAGVRAGDVKNLFPVTESPVPVAHVPVSIALNEVPEVAKAAVAAPTPPVPAPSPAKSGRATAGKGAVILNQDGKTVKFRGKCTTCGREEACYKSIPIPRGTTRAGFFCAKCRKRRDVEIHGVV
jgi:hypothetical protein